LLNEVVGLAASQRNGERLDFARLRRRRLAWHLRSGRLLIARLMDAALVAVARRHIPIDRHG